jgi:hypothetical protein
MCPQTENNAIDRKKYLLIFLSGFNRRTQKINKKGATCLLIPLATERPAICATVFQAPW